MGPQEFLKRVFELTHTKLPISQEEWDEFLNDEFDDLIVNSRTEEPIGAAMDVVQEVLQSIEGLDDADTKDDFVRQPDRKYYCNGEDVLVSSHLINKVRQNVDRSVTMRRVREIMDKYVNDNSKHIGNGVRAWFFSKDALKDMGVNIEYE